MLTDIAIRNCYVDKPLHLVTLILEMREYLQIFLPEHEEAITHNRLVLYLPEAKTSVKDSICSFSISGKNLELNFHLGSLLDDPHKLLRGSLRYKRIIKGRTLEAFKNEAVKDLLLQSYHVNRKVALYTLLPQSNAYEDLKREI